MHLTSSHKLIKGNVFLLEYHNLIGSSSIVFFVYQKSSIMKVYEEFIYSNFSGMALQTPVVAVESPSHRMQDGKDNSKNTQKWVCHICEKKFQSASHLTVHRSSHHLKDFPVHCRICFVGFSNMESCKTHELYCKIKRWECFLCHYPASYRNYLEDHMHLHSGVKRFECHICSTNYSTKPHLKRHFETTHLRIRNFQCPVCHSNFGRKQHLLKHQKSKKHFGHKSK